MLRVHFCPFWGSWVLRKWRAIVSTHPTEENALAALYEAQARDIQREPTLAKYQARKA